jgi:TRAP-type C4-dicarboxylate transport system permease small subunit
MLEHAAFATTRALSVIGLIALMALAVMTLADGLMRWVANQPIEGVGDLSGLAIAVAITCCIPMAMVERSNIIIRLASDANTALGRVLEVIAATVVAVILVAIAWQIWLFAAKMSRAHETTFVLQIPIAPFWFGVDAILWCAVLVQVIVLSRDVARALSR